MKTGSIPVRATRFFKPEPLLGNAYMKISYIILLLGLSGVCLYGKHERPAIIFTSKNVDHVRLATGPSHDYQNLVLQLPGKTSADLEAIVKSIPVAQIVKDGNIVVEAERVWGLFNKSTNYVGLILGFKEYDKAKLAEQTLRGT